mmetsp:Transcript_3039/g.5826  ORF Transcript_3039/g.5826 Transcript_3039/m.5826 type:complete len:205 (+) Transcript_3039:406-1020(+)
MLSRKSTKQEKVACVFRSRVSRIPQLLLRGCERRLSVYAETEREKGRSRERRQRHINCIQGHHAHGQRCSVWGDSRGIILRKPQESVRPQATAAYDRAGDVGGGVESGVQGNEDGYEKPAGRPERACFFRGSSQRLERRRHRGGVGATGGRPDRCTLNRRRDPGAGGTQGDRANGQAVQQRDPVRREAGRRGGGADARAGEGRA